MIKACPHELVLYSVGGRNLTELHGSGDGAAHSDSSETSNAGCTAQSNVHLLSKQMTEDDLQVQSTMEQASNGLILVVSLVLCRPRRNAAGKRSAVVRVLPSDEDSHRRGGATAVLQLTHRSVQQKHRAGEPLECGHSSLAQGTWATVELTVWLLPWLMTWCATKTRREAKT